MIFIKLLDDKQLQSEAETNILGLEPKITFKGKNDKYKNKFDYEDLRWHNFKEFEAEKMYETISEGVFPFIKKLNGDSSSSFAKYMGDAMFQIPTAQMLEKIVIAIYTLVLANPPYNAQRKHSDPGYVKTWVKNRKEDPSKGLYYVYYIASKVKNAIGTVPGAFQ